MKLISMTNFVLEQEKEPILGLINYEYQKIRKYAKFLKQPLELWMFVPCDENGNVLEIPEGIEYNIDVWAYSWNDSRFNGFFDDEEDFKEWKRNVQIYQQAKERCLFEGFKQIGNKHVEAEKYMIVGIGFKKGTHQTIEDLSNDENFKNKVTLTQTAINQLTT